MTDDHLSNAQRAFREQQERFLANVGDGSEFAARPGETDTDRVMRLSRRHLVATGSIGLAAGAALLPRAFQGVDAAQGTDATPDPHAHDPSAGVGTAVPEGLMTAPSSSTDGFIALVPFQAAIIAAAAARIIPTDDLGPGASEAGVVYFIDRQLSSEYGFRGIRYVAGPYATEPESTQGDQSKLSYRERYRLGIKSMDEYAIQKFQSGFVSLTPEQQDEILTDFQNGRPSGFGGNVYTTVPYQGAVAPATVEVLSPGQVSQSAQAFFSMLRTHVLAGFFADPIHGGNRDMVGWRMIGYPGAQAGYQNEIANYGQPFTGEPMGLAQWQQRFSGGGI